MLWFGDMRIWIILLGIVMALMVLSFVIKEVTGRDLEPPDDGGL